MIYKTFRLYRLRQHNSLPKLDYIWGNYPFVLIYNINLSKFTTITINYFTIGVGQLLPF